MDVVYPRVAGLDIHKKLIVACRIVPSAGAQVQREVRSFDTTTPAIKQLGDWLADGGVTHVAMEATGVYWKPLYNLLEDRFELVLANARHIKAVPGRKTDVKDSEWIADLLRHGLLQASFIPPQPIRDLRELTRYRKTLVQERADEINRLQKVLETANLKLGSVATDVLGKSGRDMLNAVLHGEGDPETLAALARGRLRAKLPDLRLALEGRVQPHHRFLLTRILAHIDFLEESICTVYQEIAERLRPFEEAVELLQSIPVLQETAIASIVSEIGTDMSRFPSDKHIASWAGLSPGNHESAGKRLSGSTTHGNPYLRAVLCQVAWVVAHTKDTYLSAYYHRIARRRGKKKAIVAVAHKLLIIIYHVLSTKKPYEELGADYFDQLDKARIERRAVQRLEQLGYIVTLTTQDDAA